MPGSRRQNSAPPDYLDSQEAVARFVKGIATINPKASQAKVEEIIDNRIVRKLDESGFIDALYRKN